MKRNGAWRTVDVLSRRCVVNGSVATFRRVSEAAAVRAYVLLRITVDESKVEDSMHVIGDTAVRLADSIETIVSERGKRCGLAVEK